MEDLNNKTPVQAVDSDLQAQFDALRHLVMSILILLIVISGTFNIYLLRQWRTVSKELLSIQQQAAPLFADYQKSGPLMDDFVNKITEYGRTHADFAPIVSKYNLRPVVATSAPPITPAGSAAPKQKK
jgi:hypothetical protein